MREILGVGGNVHYLIDVDNDIAYAFDGTFGRSQGSVTGKYAVFSSKARNDVDILSVLGNNVMPVSDVYFAGYRGSCNMKAFDAIRAIPKSYPKMNHLIYRVARDEDEPGLMQLLIPFKKDMLSKESLGTVLGITEWFKI